VTRLAKAVSAFTHGRSASVAAGRDASSFVTRVAPSSGNGSSAPTHLHVHGGRALATAFALAVALLVLASTAQAAKKVDSFFGSTGSLGGQFAEVRDIATYEGTLANPAPPGYAGDIYVVERNASHRIQRFSAGGAFELAFGRDVVIPGGAGDVVGPNEVQTVTINGAPTGGTFTMRLGVESTQTVGAIAFNASAEDLEDGLETSSAIGPGNVSVTSPNPGGGASAGGPYTVEFIGALADRDVTQLTGQSSLTPSGSFTIATVTPGGDKFERCTVAANCRAGTAGSQSGMFTNPSGIAVNQDTGHVYVWDRANRRVQEFDKDGNFVRMWGADVITSGANNNGTLFEVCDTTAGNAASDCKQGASATFGGGFATFAPTSNNGIAISPTTGNVFVIDAQSKRLQQFTSSGAFVRAWGWDVDKTTTDSRFEVCTTTCGAAANAPPSNPNGAFGSNQPSFVAAGTAGIVYASDSNGRIVRFDSTQTPPQGAAPSLLLSEITSAVIGDIEATAGLEADPDTGNLFVARGASAAASVGVKELCAPSPPTNPVTALCDTHGPAGVFGVNGMGLDSSSGRLYLATSTGGDRVVALDDDGAPAPIVSFEEPTDVGPETVTLHATVNPNGVGLNTSYHFEVSKDGSIWDPVAPDVNLGDGNTPIPIDDVVTGLDPNTLYLARIATSKSLGAGSYFSATAFFVTDPAPPTPTTSPIGPRTTTGAELRGLVDPNGTATTYWFQYGTDTGYGNNVPISPAAIGAGNEPIAVIQQIDGLTPATTYHYRIAADGFGAPAFGDDVTFTTHPQPSFPAQGARAFELVSPVIKQTGPGVGGHGSNSSLNGEIGLRSGLASLDGERFVLPTESGPVLTPGAAVFVDNFALGERGEQGWVTKPLANRPNYGSPITPFLDFVGANRSLSLMSMLNGASAAFLFPEMAGSFVADASPWYMRDWAGNWEMLAPIDPAQPLPGVGSRVAFDEAGSTTVLSSRSWGMLGSGDASLGQVAGTRATYVHDTSAGLSDTFPGDSPRSLLGVCTGTGPDRTLLPERLASGKLSAQVCPPPDSGRDDSLTSVRGAGVTSTSNASSMTNVVSADGSRVFFMSPDPFASGAPGSCSTAAIGTATDCPPQLFVRQLDQGGNPVVRWISRPAVIDQDASLLGRALFEGASTDGDKVFFRTTSPLTADDPNGGAQVPGGVTTGSASASSWDLYMYDFPDGPAADPGSGTLTRISAGPTGGADPNVKSPGALRFSADDGERLYFVTRSPISGTPAPGDGTITAPSGTPGTNLSTNLYAYDAAAPAPEGWRFVAELSMSGGPLSECASTGNEIGQPRSSQAIPTGLAFTIEGDENCVRGTADGAFVTFWTDARLIADDPDSVTGDVYGYDADRDDLVRLTAPQGTAAVSYLCNMGDFGNRNDRCFGDGGFDFPSANTGQNVPVLLGVATEPGVPGDRVAFFQSRSRLVPEDENGVMDVYQWRNGDLSLISSGAADADGSFYSGNDKTGRDVFLVTRDVLSWQDIDGVRDVYDARVGGGFPEPLSPPACDVLADGCQGAPAVVPAATGASSTVLAGAGNVTEPTKPRKCGKGKVRRGGKCLRKGSRKHSQRANHDWRASK
jgi:hypothetical protein